MMEEIEKIFTEKMGGVYRAAKFHHGTGLLDRKVLFLVTDGDKPVAVTKVSRDAAYNGKIEHEMDAELASDAYAPIPAPKVLFALELSGRKGFAEAAADGVPLSKRTGKGYAQEIFERCDRVASVGKIGMDEFIAAVENTGGYDPEIGESVSGLKALKLSVSKLCLAPQHGDLTYKNIIAGTELTLIDWERAGERAVWGTDFVHYFVRCCDIESIAEWKERFMSLGVASAIVPADYFEAAYLADRIYDRLFKSDRKAYDALCAAVRP